MKWDWSIPTDWSVGRLVLFYIVHRRPIYNCLRRHAISAFILPLHRQQPDYFSTPLSLSLLLVSIGHAKPSWSWGRRVCSLLETRGIVNGFFFFPIYLHFFFSYCTSSSSFSVMLSIEFSQRWTLRSRLVELDPSLGAFVCVCFGIQDLNGRWHSARQVSDVYLFAWFVFVGAHRRLSSFEERSLYRSRQHSRQSIWIDQVF